MTPDNDDTKAPAIPRVFSENSRLWIRKNSFQSDNQIDTFLQMHWILFSQSMGQNYV